MSINPERRSAPDTQPAAPAMAPAATDDGAAPRAGAGTGTGTSAGAGTSAGTVAAAAPAGCFHCGLPLPRDGRWSVRIDEVERPMCCPGCASVAQAIVDIGQSAYYRDRTEFGATASADQLVPPELQLYTNADPRFADCEDGRAAALSVEGIRCAACVWLIERRLQQQPGVIEANLNVATETLHVRWDPAHCEPAQILQAVREVGYTAYPYEAGRHGEQLQRAVKTLGRQLFVAGLSMMQVMMYVAPAYLAGDDGTLEPAMAALMRWASLLLTLPAVCYSALPFYRGALSSLRARVPGMDVPVTLGIVAAFGASLIATWRGTGEVYFDSVTMFIFLLLCSRYLELQARRKAAGALQRLHHALPASATRVAGYPDQLDGSVVPAASLAVGDVILVKPGEAVAADCVLLDADTAFDVSLLTGESAPQLKRMGEDVPGGAINASRAVLARVTRTARDSTLSDLIRLVERAGQGKPRIALWADKAAAHFVTALLIFALLSFGFWYWYDPARAWPVAIAVLVVSCPCALSLATPTALAAAGDRLLRRGVLAVGPQTLETLHRATHIVFDKTGTLTVGKPVLQDVLLYGDARRADCVQIAAALEASSAHPLARALAAAADGPLPWNATQVEETPGQGLSGMVDGQHYRLGNAAFVAGLAGPNDDGPLVAGAPGTTAVFLGSAQGWLACFLLQDALREDARATVDYFRAAGKTVVLLSGDTPGLTRHVAEALGISHAQGGCLPADKLAYVQNLQAEGAVVAMVGDGINDAAVLRAANVSFAMGSGAALAQAQADAVLLSGSLDAVAGTARTARATMAVIRQNLAWATLYNLVAIPAAALGWLNPWLSGAGMAISSAVVVLNAVRLRRA
ncbi:MAG TPA: heavy metal translocating P-type ATPase [Burkholderiaceae bacterium]|nr:heavy metal translocating P-type ATPase [Burkholderiaceae bacterium]